MRPVLIKEHLPNSVNICQRLVDGILNIPSKDMFNSRKMEIAEGWKLPKVFAMSILIERNLLNEDYNHAKWSDLLFSFCVTLLSMCKKFYFKNNNPAQCILLRLSLGFYRYDWVYGGILFLYDKVYSSLFLCFIWQLYIVA